MFKFDWERYIIKGMFDNIVTMNLDELILVNDIDYLKPALKIYQNAASFQKKELKNLLIWSIVKDKTGLLPKKFKDAKLDFDKVLKSI